MQPIVICNVHSTVKCTTSHKFIATLVFTVQAMLAQY